MATQPNAVVVIHDYAVTLNSIASAHWEGSRLFVHLDGGRFLQLDGERASLVWQAYTSGATDLRTGELLVSA